MTVDDVKYFQQNGTITQNEARRYLGLPEAAHFTVDVQGRYTISNDWRLTQEVADALKTIIQTRVIAAEKIENGELTQ